MAEQHTFERPALSSGGANQVRVKAYNERLVLSLVRRHGSLAKADVSRLSGLSAQAVTVLIRGLEEDQLLVRGEPRRGKVGQPSIPLSLNPDGAYAVGVTIGRRSADVVLVDFLGQVRARRSVGYRWPDPEALLQFAVAGVRELLAALSTGQRRRVIGTGIAMPGRIWEWPAELGVPETRLEAWRDSRFAELLSDATDTEVFVYNDGTSACGAELAFGEGVQYHDFVYFFVATFIGGGIVLNRTLYPGRTGNAATLGTMVFTHDNGSTTQLLHHASVLSLEQRVAKHTPEGRDVNWQAPEQWVRHRADVEPWLDTVAHYLAVAIGSACSIVDFEAAIIDGIFPDDVKVDLVARVQKRLTEIDQKGVTSPDVIGGSLGQTARVLGGASRVMMERYFLNQSVLFSSVS